MTGLVTTLEPILYAVGIVVVVLAGLAGLYTAAEFVRLIATAIHRSLR